MFFQMQKVKFIILILKHTVFFFCILGTIFFENIKLRRLSQLQAFKLLNDENFFVSDYFVRAAQIG